MRRPYISMFHHHHGISVAVLAEDAVDYWQRTEGHDPTNEYELLEEVELPPLYAAAPAMLGFLHQIAAECERRLRKGEDSGDRLTLQLCKAAISKAEGRE